MISKKFGRLMASQDFICIILEERSKMSRKILDAAVTTAFYACLIATPNILEKDAAVMQTSSAVCILDTIIPEEGTARAGFHSEFSRLSFTTESGGETEIEKNEVLLVKSQKDHIESRKEVMPADESAGASIPADVPVSSEEAEVVETSVAAVAAADTISNRWNINLTEDEIDLLARIVWLEANGEPVEGQQAVVEVVFNRMASDLYPDTLYDVLSQKNPVQFCSWKNRNHAEPTEKEYQSIKQVLNGNTSILRNDTLYFSTKPLTSNTDVRIGGHSFCY